MIAMLRQRLFGSRYARLRIRLQARKRADAAAILDEAPALVSPLSFDVMLLAYKDL
jgi:hypothetical protein